MDSETTTEFADFPNILTEDGVVNYDFMISLKDAARAKIVSSLWLTERNRRAIASLFHHECELTRRGFNDKWKQIEKNVIDQIMALPLPKTIIQQLTNISSRFRESVFNWIQYHDVCIFETDKYSKYSAVDLINNIKWTTRGKIDYEQTARTILANVDSGITDDHKYKIACTYCLEDEIANIFPIVTMNLDYLGKIDTYTHPMVHFWTMLTAGDREDIRYVDRLRDRYLDYCQLRGPIISLTEGPTLSINEYMLQLLMSKKKDMAEINEIPIKYVWNHLSEREKNKNIMKLMELLYYKDSRFSLLSNLECEQQTEVFKACCDTILCDILNDWSWRRYFLPTALHILDIMTPVSYVFILSHILMENEKQVDNEYNQYKYFFSVLWQKGSHLILEEEEDGLESVARFLYLLSWKQDMDIIDLIFKDLSTDHKKLIILNEHGSRKCVDFIVHNEWNSLELFIKYAISSYDDVEKLKQKLISKAGSVATGSIHPSAWTHLEYFLNQVFHADDEKKTI